MCLCAHQSCCTPQAAAAAAAHFLLLFLENIIINSFLPFGYFLAELLQFMKARRIKQAKTGKMPLDTGLFRRGRQQ